MKNMVEDITKPVDAPRSRKTFKNKRLRSSKIILRKFLENNKKSEKKV